MNIIEQTYRTATAAVLQAQGINADHVKEPKMYGFDEEREYGRMLEANHDDLMDQLRYAEVAKSIIHDHGLDDTDLLQLLMTAGAMWDEKPETALERMKAIHRLIWLAIDRIAKDMTEREFNAMCERL